MLTVVAQITAKKGREEEVLNVLKGLIGPTHQEEGCLDYDLHRSLENPAEFVFYENWVSREALDRHSCTPHLKDFAAKADDLLDKPVSITLWTRLNEPKRK